MAYNPSNPNGQTTAANSQPVVLASDQLPIGAALADGTTTPTTTIVGSALMAYNGTNFDRVRTIDSMSGTGANNTVVGILAVGTGPGFAHRYNPTALGTAANSTSIIDVEGGNTMTFGIGTSTTGTFTFEATSDGTNWFGVEVFDATNDIWASGQNLTPTSGKTYHIACGGMRQIRIRTVTTLGATVAHFVNVTNSQQLIAGIDTGAAPHNFGYTVIHKDGEYTTAQTGTNLWTPTAGKKFVVTDLTITTGGTTAGLVTLFQAASATTTFAAGTTPAIFRGNFIPSATSTPGVVKPFPVPYVSTTADHTLHVTTSAAMTVYIQVNGYEI